MGVCKCSSNKRLRRSNGKKMFQRMGGHATKTKKIGMQIEYISVDRLFGCAGSDKNMFQRHVSDATKEMINPV